MCFFYCTEVQEIGFEVLLSCTCVCVCQACYDIQSRCCQPCGERGLNLSRGLRISLCLLLWVKYVISYLRSVKEPKRKEGIPAIYV